MALAHYILGKFLGVGCHCFPPHEEYTLYKILEIGVLTSAWSGFRCVIGWMVSDI